MHVEKIVGKELDEAALKYQRAHPTVSYSEALSAVMLDNADLAKGYVQEFGHLSRRHVKQFGIEDAGLEDSGTIAAEKEIDRLVQAWLADHPTEKGNYAKGLEIVLARHPDLRVQWTKKYSPGVSFSKDFEHVVVVEHEADKTAADKSASAEVDALIKKLHRENPAWSIEKCIAEAHKRLKAKGAQLAELSEEMQTAQDRLKSFQSA